MARFIPLLLRRYSKPHDSWQITINAEQVCTVQEADGNEGTCYVATADGETHWVAAPMAEVVEVLSGWASPMVWEKVTGAASFTQRHSIDPPTDRGVRG